MTMTRMTRRVMTWNTTGKLKKFRVNLQDAEKKFRSVSRTWKAPIVKWTTTTKELLLIYYIFTLQSVFLEKSEYAIVHYRSCRQEYILYMYLYNTHSYISRAEFTKKSTETNIFIINLSIKMHSGRRNFQTKKSNSQTKRSSCLKH